MSKKKKFANNRRPDKRARKGYSEDITQEVIQDYMPHRSAEPFSALNEAQGAYASMIMSRKVTFGTGAAGTGKSYVALALAAETLLAGKIDRIVVVRPLVETGEEVGILPGELEDKIAPYFTPARDILIERLGRGHFTGLMKAHRIEFLPLAYLRGTTFKNCWVILDEGQNTTKTQMKMLLTRLGSNSKLIVNGDTSQCDLDDKTPSGLTDALQRLRKSKNVGKHHFMQSDIVRDDFVKEVIVAYEGSDGSLQESISK